MSSRSTHTNSFAIVLVKQFQCLEHKVRNLQVERQDIEGGIMRIENFSKMAENF